ncbi:MAG TPA: formate/nitrite transporter family protein [Alloacidobacterium sp.]|jgi:formate/nitrite transporter FocA (FNT family)|nr:formate/nitrite transporter family protein [Alloacidobacterium sp.]
MPLPKIKLPASPEDTSASVQRDLDRPTASEIYQQVSKNARRELSRTNMALAVSGIVGGLTMGLTGLSVALVRAQLGNSSVAAFISMCFYPMGFMAVILGRGQLFTENTLYPVALVLTERRHFWSTMRLWAVVLSANVVGAFLFAMLAVRTGALRTEYADALARLGDDAASSSASHIFWSAVVGGWIIAMVAWLVSGSHSITGAVMLIWTLTFIVGLGHFAHCIATSGEILAAVLHGQLAASSYFRWLVPAVLGNITGGVLLVTLLEYGQVNLE